MNWKHRIIAVSLALAALAIVVYIVFWRLPEVSTIVKIIIIIVCGTVIQRLQDEYVKNAADREKVDEVGKFYIKTYSASLLVR